MDWCCENNLTGELIIDFRRKRHSHSPLIVNNKAVEVVSSTTFLGVHVSDRLDWSLHMSLQRAVRTAEKAPDCSPCSPQHRRQNQTCRAVVALLFFLSVTSAHTL